MRRSFKRARVVLLSVSLLASLVPATSVAAASFAITGPDDVAFVKDSTPHFRGTGTSGQTVRLFLGSTLKGTATVSSGGSWALDSTLVADGSRTFTARQYSGATQTASDSVSITIDTVKPTITGSRDRAPNAAGWYRAPVTVHFSCADTGGSGIASCSSDVFVAGHGANQSALGTAVDRAGNSTTTTVSDIDIDLLRPLSKVNGVTDGSIYVKGNAPSPSCSTTDGTSGVARVALLSVTPGNGDGTGQFTAACTNGADRADNISRTVSARYTIRPATYPFSFVSPTRARPARNDATAGTTTPIHFSLGGFYGSDFLLAGSPTSAPLDCSTGAVGTQTATSPVPPSGVAYDTSTKTYTYRWTTDASWAGTCRRLFLRPNDGIVRSVDVFFSQLAATASSSPRTTFLAAPTTYAFAVKNAGSSAIGGVVISRPWSAWTVTACPAGPAGWTRTQSPTACTYQRTTGSALAPGQTATSFRVTALATGDGDRTGTWSVAVTKTSDLAPSGRRAATPASTGALGVTAYAFEVTRAVVASSAATPGAACPAANSTAPANSSVVIVICGRNRSTATITPGSGSSLSGTFLASSGTFGSGPVAPTAGAPVVLGSWSGAVVTSSIGSGKTIVSRVAAGSSRTSPLATFTGYTATNQAPAASDTSATTTEDTDSSPITLTGSDADGDDTTFSIVTGPSHGSLGTISSPSCSGTTPRTCTATVVYTPAADYHGSDAFTYRVHDGVTHSPTATVSLTVDPVNDAPSAVALSDTNVPENEPSGTVVGTLSATDADSSDSHTFTLVTGTGDTHNGSFSIVGDELRTGAVFDHETKSSYEVRVRADDGNGATREQAFTISVVDVNDTPTDIALSDDTIAEGEPSGTVVGTLSATDQDAGATHTFALVSGTGDTDNGSFSIVGDELRSGAVFDRETKSSYTVRVRATDGAGATREEAFTITVTDANDAPSDLALSNSSVAENEPSGTAVGTLSATDQDAADTHTYSLVAGTGDSDNASFTIVGSELRTAAVLDFEDDASRSVRIRASDGNGGTRDEVFTITVTNANDAPSDIALSDANIPENEPSGTAVGTLSATDQDAGAAHTFTLVSGVGDTDNASFTIVGDELRSAAVFDRETKSSYTVRVRADDGAGGTLEEAFTITVTDANDAPTDIALSNDTIVEDQPSGTPVGTFSATDQDASAAHTFTLVAGTGDTHNASFTIVGDELRTAASLDAGSYAIRVRADDGQGGTFEEAFTIEVVPPNATPTDIALSNASVPENSASGTPVGTLTTTDADATDTHTYSLVSGVGDTDNASFTIVGDELRTAAVFDRETKSSYSVRIQTDDGQPAGTYSEAFTITVTDVNEAPTDITLAPSSVPENQPSGTAVGTLTATDPEVADTHTFALVAGNGDTDNASFTIVGSELRTAASFDYETKASYTVRVRATDTGALTFEEALTITVTNVNDGPTVNTSSGTASFTEDGGPVTVDPDLTVSDVDSANLQGATVTITTNHDATDDVLAIADTPGITESYSSGTLTLTGTASVATYQAALRSVTYDNTDSAAPSTTTRTVVFEVADTDAATGSDTRGVSVTAVDDPPVAVDDTATLAEDAGATSIPVLTNDTDVDAGPKTISSATDPANGTVVLTGGSAGARTGLTYQPDPNYCNSQSGGTADTFSYTLNGGDSATVSMTVTCVNDAPVAGADGFQTLGNTELRVDLGTTTTPAAAETTTGGTGVRENDSDPVEGDPTGVTGIVGCSDATAPFDCTVSSQHIVMQSDGKFSYVPAPGTTSGSFQYTLTDTPAVGSPASANGTVTMTMLDMVWYVNGGAAVGGTGTSEKPLNSFVGISGPAGAGDSDAANAYIFVHSSNVSGGGIELEAGQRLWGEGFGLSIPQSLNGNGSPTVLVAPGTKPVINSSAVPAVTATAALPAEIRGLTLTSIANAVDVTTTGAYSGSGTLLIDGNTFAGSALETLDINGGATGSAAVSIKNNTWSGTHTGSGIDVTTTAGRIDLDVAANSVTVSGNAIVATQTAGTLNVRDLAGNTVAGATGGGGISVTNAGLDANGETAGSPQVAGGTTTVGTAGNGVGTFGINLTNVTGRLGFDQLTIVNDNGTGLQVSAPVATPMTLVIGGTSTIVSAGGAAASLTNVVATVPLSRISSTNSAGNGVLLDNVSGAFTVTDATSAITTASGADFRINGGSATVTYPGTITDDVGQLVRINGATGGIKTFSGAITDNGDGDGGIPGGEGSIELSSNAGATVNFTGGITLSTGANAAFRAIGGGTVSATQNNSSVVNTLAATAGAALNVTNTSIGAADLTFRSISSSAGGNGIVLIGTGSSGGLTVTGNGGTCTPASTGGCSGGTISGTTGADSTSTTPTGVGILLSDTEQLSLTRMWIHDHSNYGIRGTAVSGFVFDSGVVNAVVGGTPYNGTNSSGGYNESSIYFDNSSGVGLEGTVSVTNSTITSGYANDFWVSGAAGVLNATFTNVVFGLNTSPNHNDSLQVEGMGTSTTNVTVKSSTFRSTAGDHFQYIGNGTGGGTLDYDGNVHTNNHPAIATGGGYVTISGGAAGKVIIDIHGANTFRDGLTNAITLVKSFGVGDMDARVTGITVGVAGVPNSGSAEGSGIAFNHNGGDANSDVRLTVTNNTIREYNNYGIALQAGAGIATGGHLDAVVTGNTISNPGTNASVSNIFQGLSLNNGVTPANVNGDTVNGDSFQTCLDLGSNSASNSGRNGGHDIRVRQRMNTSVRLPGYTGGTGDTAAVAAYLLGRNTAITASAVRETSNVPSGAGFLQGGSCAQATF